MSNKVKISHKTRAPWRFLANLTKFDLESISNGSKNPDFDPDAGMGWNQCHYEDYPILVPTTIHGSKLELKRLRYWENYEKHISTLLTIITFDPTVGFLISLTLWKLDTHSFPGTPRLPQSKSGKTSKCASEVRTQKVHEDEIDNVSWAWLGGPWKAAKPREACQGYKYPLAP